jgi:dihydrolipoamide dehydrogenase
MDTQKYDVIVLGAGPGGYVCAIRASQLGLKTAIVDKQWLGGVCMNIGCIPSKALLKSAEVADLLRHHGEEFGFSFENLALNYGAAVQRSRQAANRLAKGVYFLMRKNKIDVRMGAATIRGPSTAEVTTREGEIETLEARHIVVATGARPSLLPGIAADGKKILTYQEAILQETLPASAVIIGGGAIGVEFATLWNAYGTKVTVVEMLPTLVPREDEEIAAELARQFHRAGIQVMTGTKVDQIDITGDGVHVKVTGPGGTTVLDAEQTLVAVGFQPQSANLGLEALGVKLERGFIQIDERMQTSVPGVWAIGDVTGKCMLAHAASAQGIVCAESMAGAPTRTLHYQDIPSATYSHPQVASFGLTEKQAGEQGRAVQLARFPFTANGKALGIGQARGFVKIICDARDGAILGAHMIGPDVTELLPELTLAHAARLTIADVAHNIHAHPTLSEALSEAAHGLAGGYIHL